MLRAHTSMALTNHKTPITSSPMSRWLPPNNEDNTMTCQSPELFTELLSSIPRKSKSDATADRKNADKEYQNDAKKRAAERVMAKRNMLSITHKALDAKIRSDINVRMIKEEKIMREEAARRLQEIEDEQAGFVTDVMTMTDRAAEAKRMASLDMLNMWNEQVYQKINTRLKEKVGDIDRKQLSRRLNKQLNEYVENVKKHPVFLDIITEAEYNPFDSKRETIKLDTNVKSRKAPDGIVDPLNEQIAKVMEIHEGMGHLLQTGGRISDLPVRMWSGLIVRSTPVGFAENCRNPPKPRSNRRCQSEDVLRTFDHYDYLKGHEAMVMMKQEVGPGKKCFPMWMPGGKQGHIADWKPPFSLDKDPVVISTKVTH